MMPSLRSIAPLALAGSLLWLAGCSDSRKVDPQPSASAISEAADEMSDANDPAKIDALKQALKAEPKVIDFVYDQNAVFRWTIGVQDDGTPRYGYAEYICSLMAEHGLATSGAKVRTVDYQKFMRPGGNGRDSSLGSVDCETSRHMMP